jgi:putative spermidine/putrescine transport system permease protein
MSPVERVWFYSLRILCGLILLFLILPVLVIIPLSFNSGTFLVYPLQGFSLRWYADFFSSAEWMRSLTNSMIVAPAATVLAMVFGTLASIGLTRGEFPWQGADHEPADFAHGGARGDHRCGQLPVLRPAGPG